MSDSPTSIFLDVMDEQKQILGQEEAEGALNTCVTAFEHTLDQKAVILTQYSQGNAPYSLSDKDPLGEHQSASRPSTIFADVMDEKLDVLRDHVHDTSRKKGHIRAQSPLTIPIEMVNTKLSGPSNNGSWHTTGNKFDEKFPTAANACILPEMNHLEGAYGIFEDPLDEQDKILQKNLRTTDRTENFEDPLDVARRRIFKQFPAAYPATSPPHVDIRCDICQALTLDKCIGPLQPRTNFYLDKIEQNVGYWHQNSFKELRESAESGCTMCQLFKTSTLECGQDEKTLLSLEEAHGDFPVIIRADSYLRGLIRMLGPKGQHEISHLTIQLGMRTPKDKEDRWPEELPVTKLQIFTYPCDHAATDTRLTGRPIALDAMSEASFAFIDAWLMQCSSTHETCPERKPQKLPTRVIDVGPSDGSQEPRIHFSSQGETGFYIALSHCWGKERTLIATQSSIESMRKEIPFFSIPKTFADAIRVTRKLSIRYLWIDSLCIIQDSVPDWNVESTKMRDVYANSFLTIAAAMGKNSHQGFLEQRTKSLISPILALKHGHPKYSGEGTVYLRPDGTGWRSTVTEGTLSRRAWTFQERLLPSRILHFGSNQMFFECNYQDTSEGYIRGQKNDPGEEGEQLSKRIIHNWERHDYIMIPYPMGRWYACVREYTQRHLTNPSDKLVAISGIARELLLRTPALQCPEPYLAGLWRADILRGLLWQSVRNMKLAPVESYRAPSWSWAALEGMIKWEFTSLDRLQAGTGASVVHAEVETEGEDQFGQVCGGSITLRGHIRPGVYFGDREGEKSRTVYGQRLVTDGNDPQNRTYHLFEPSNEEGKWQTFCDCMFDQSPSSGYESFALLRIGNWTNVVSMEMRSRGKAIDDPTTNTSQQASFFVRPSNPEYEAWALILKEASPEPARRWRRVGIARMNPSNIENWNVLDTTII